MEKDVIKYDFVEGPLTRILKKAFTPGNEGNMYYLIIEELNRGNAPAIFGDVFQLLDRDKLTGNSEYPIDNCVEEEIIEATLSIVKVTEFKTVNEFEVV